MGNVAVVKNFCKCRCNGNCNDDKELNSEYRVALDDNNDNFIFDEKFNQSQSTLERLQDHNLDIAANASKSANSVNKKLTQDMAVDPKKQVNNLSVVEEQDQESEYKNMSDIILDLSKPRMSQNVNVDIKSDLIIDKNIQTKLDIEIENTKNKIINIGQINNLKNPLSNSSKEFSNSTQENSEENRFKIQNKKLGQEQNNYIMSCETREIPKAQRLSTMKNIDLNTSRGQIAYNSQ